MTGALCLVLCAAGPPLPASAWDRRPVNADDVSFEPPGAAAAAVVRRPAGRRRAYTEAVRTGSRVMSRAELVQQILRLPRAERRAIVDEVSASLDPPVPEEPTHDGPLHPDWDKEIVSRLDEIDSGKAKMVSLEEVRSWLYEGLRD